MSHPEANALRPKETGMRWGEGLPCSAVLRDGRCGGWVGTGACSLTQVPWAHCKVTGASLGNEQGSFPCLEVISRGASDVSRRAFTISDLGSRQYLQSEVEELRAAEEPGQRGLS